MWRIGRLTKRKHSPHYTFILHFLFAPSLPFYFTFYVWEAYYVDKIHILCFAKIYSQPQFYDVRVISLLDIHGSVHRNLNLIERTNKIQPRSRIYYSKVS